MTREEAKERTLKAIPGLMADLTSSKGTASCSQFKTGIVCAYCPVQCIGTTDQQYYTDYIAYKYKMALKYATEHEEEMLEALLCPRKKELWLNA